MQRVAGADEDARIFASAVARRLADDLHRPAVQERLGCLIPEDLHPNQDNKKINVAVNLSLRTFC